MNFPFLKSSCRLQQRLLTTKAGQLKVKQSARGGWQQWKQLKPISSSNLQVADLLWLLRLICLWRGGAQGLQVTDGDPSWRLWILWRFNVWVSKSNIFYKGQGIATSGFALTHCSCMQKEFSAYLLMRIKQGELQLRIELEANTSSYYFFHLFVINLHSIHSNMLRIKSAY